MVAGTRRLTVVAEAGSTRSGDSPRPEDPVCTLSTSEPPVPAPACTTSGAKRTVCGTLAKGAGKALVRGSLVTPLRETSSWQPKELRQAWA